MFAVCRRCRVKVCRAQDYWGAGEGWLVDRAGPQGAVNELASANSPYCPESKSGTPLLQEALPDFLSLPRGPPLPLTCRRDPVPPFPRT